MSFINLIPLDFAVKILTLVVILAFFNSLYMISKENKLAPKKESLKYETEKCKVFPVAQNYERKDWHDWAFIEYEKTRTGPGEQGKPHFLTDPYEIELNENLSKVEGLSPLVTDKISVNRSVPDGRLPFCKTIKYLKELPKTSVVIVFYNELSSLLLRTVHSVYNRTPRKLLHEIILVNDCSTKEELYEPLQTYVRNNFDSRVMITNLEERKGLIVARMKGARRATGEVLVFLDAHMEVHINWLPPLLEPIAIDPLTSTLPIIDDADPDDFSITFMGQGGRGVFDWELYYRWLPRSQEHQIYPEKPSPNPIMLGGAFAIRRDYFFHLGGYDEQLKIWNGENYELSLKLWLCGGKILEVPCARVSHVFRYKSNHRKRDADFDYVKYNFKRIAEVWFGEFKHCLYATNPEKYRKVDPGDLTKALQVKQSLNCKPFQYILEQVMPDQMFRYPCNPGVFASGAIQSVAHPEFCLDMLGTDTEVGLSKCSSNRTRPHRQQRFVLTWHRQIKNMVKFAEHCLIASDASFDYCKFELGTQLWFYNMTSRHITNSPEKCLTAVIESKTVTVTKCEEDDQNQRFIWGFKNTTALENWKTFGVQLPKCLEGKFSPFSCI